LNKWLASQRAGTEQSWTQQQQDVADWLASQRTAQQREYEDNLRALNEWLASQRAGTEQSWTQQQQDLADWLAAQNRAAQLKAEMEYLEYVQAMQEAARRASSGRSGGGSSSTYTPTNSKQNEQTFQAAYDAVFKSGGDYKENFNKIARQVYQIGGEKTYNRLKNTVEQADRQKRKNYIDQNPYLYQYMLKYGPGGVL
jgi:type II secretory pathway pseudopilin PulG